MGGLINFSDMIWHVVNVVILFFFLRWLLYKPVVNFLKKREEKFALQANDLEVKEKALEEEKNKYDELMKNSKEEAANILKSSTEAANLRAAEIIENAQKEAQFMIQKTEHDIDEKSKQAMIDLKADIAEMACDLASKILKREINEEDNKAIIDDFFKRVG